MTDFGLLEDEIKLFHDVFAQYNLQKVNVFGSRAMGNYKSYSDIDFVVFDNIGDETLGDLKLRLEDVQVPYKIDILVYSQISHEGLKDHIKRVGLVFYEGEL